VQRSSANRFTGWISYAFGRTGMRDSREPAGSGDRFPSDYDQRHTMNIYGGYRCAHRQPELKWSYGSGFPIPGYLRRRRELLPHQQPQPTAAHPYQRTDFRVNKVLDQGQVEADSLRRSDQPDQPH
jgi:hypothetical protein